MMEVRRHKRYVLKTILQLEKKYGRMSVLDVLGEWFIKPYYGKFRIK